MNSSLRKIPLITLKIKKNTQLININLSFALPLGAHMRRASAELAERRRASFGSRGKDENIVRGMPNGN